ncbi:hypothetical protein GJ689_19760 [Rhodoplanes serenus]|uniref:DUF6538 domain-containing protein n=1 Tax=Rhodoplanes serenus TaxID=200615 RepID=A0A9X5AUK1_9BRAD|nr:DUF6538 domain-containing protein [Rhodoplanes serenus]MTW18440.1 hypothetical protein [Rhodoplanes serenus]
MTYLIRRGSTWHFRFRLPDDLRGHAVPDHWPSNLEPLVNRKLGRLKQEITESLRTAENSIARARAGVRIGDTELLVREARRFLAEGPALTIPEDVIEFLAERRAQELLAADDALRAKGLGLDLERVREVAFAGLGVPAGEPPSEPAQAPPRRGMTRDDLGRSELAQLEVRDVRRDPETGIAFLDITDERGKALKAKTSKRQVPLHPVLGEIGFFEFLDVRRAAAADETARLFPAWSRAARRRVGGERRGRSGSTTGAASTSRSSGRTAARTSATRRSRPCWRRSARPRGRRARSFPATRRE